MYFVWYDDNPKKTTRAKIDEAIVRYKEHYGRNPDICMLNEAVLPAAQDQSQLDDSSGVRVMAAKNVPQHYFWVGNEA